MQSVDDLLVLHPLFYFVASVPLLAPPGASKVIFLSRIIDFGFLDIFDLILRLLNIMLNLFGQLLFDLRVLLLILLKLVVLQIPVLQLGQLLLLQPLLVMRPHDEYVIEMLLEILIDQPMVEFLLLLALLIQLSPLF